MTGMQLVHTEEVARLLLPVRVQALAVAAGAVAVPGLAYVPVVVAVGGVAVLAESRVVVEPGRVDLGEAHMRPERLDDPSGPVGVDWGCPSN